MVHVLVVVLLACAATRTVQSYDYYDYYDADADDAPVLTVRKYCRIPRLKQMQIVNQESDKPWEFAGALVKTDISNSLFYRCNSSTDWKRATCQDGQWDPHIPTQCIDHTCYLDKTGEEKEPNTRANITCTGGHDLSTTCSSSGGYWFPGCGERMNGAMKGKFFDRIASQPLQPVKLTANAKSTIVLCPKGQELMRCVSAGSAGEFCTPFNEAFLLSSQDESPIMLSGLEITSSTNFTKDQERKLLKCKDVDECKVIKWDKANSAAAGKPQYLNERGILKCGDEASCENTECKDQNTCEGNDYQCKCRESWEFNEADRSCKFMARVEPRTLEPRTVFPPTRDPRTVAPPVDDEPIKCPAPGEIQPGLLRTAEEINEELPEGCTVSVKSADERARIRDDGDVASVTCDPERASAAKFIQAVKPFWSWSDGNCACPSYQYYTCPSYIYSGSVRYQVVHDGPSAQCWVQAYCGREKGICQGRCQTVYRWRTVLVYNPATFFKWVSIQYPAYCACRGCDGKPCTY